MNRWQRRRLIIVVIVAFGIAGLVFGVFALAKPKSNQDHTPKATIIPTTGSTLLTTSQLPTSVISEQIAHPIKHLPVSVKGSSDEEISLATIDDETLPISNQCGLSSQIASPNNRWIMVGIGCDVSSFTQIIDVTTGEYRRVEPSANQESLFLNWSPDGDSAILRLNPTLGDQIVLVDLENGTTEELNVDPYTFGATLSADEQRVLYTVSRGLGLGGELWLMNRDGSNKQLLLEDPNYIFIFPSWSPDGTVIIYIRMMQTNIPFTVGELWTADGDGTNPRKLADADAGHGYPPLWSPDGRWIAFIVRENPNDVRADNIPWELESNIYLVNAQTGETSPLTQFENTLTGDITWSPDGKQLAFRTIKDGKSAIWVANIETSDLKQLTEGEGVNMPIWILGEGSSQP